MKHQVASREEWLAARTGLLEEEKELTRRSDELARRDADLMAELYRFFGLTVGTVVHGIDANARRAAYRCDITYCTNKELVFDYLRDRLALGARRARARLLVHELFKTGLAGRAPALLLRGLHFAIVDGCVMLPRHVEDLLAAAS